MQLGRDVVHLSGIERFEVIEVEAQPPRLDQGSGLRRVLTETVSENPVQDVGRGVRALRAEPSGPVDECSDLVPHT